MAAYIRWLHDVGLEQLAEVGGKNASLGEMIRQLSERDIRVPGGFATTAAAFRHFIAHNDLETRISQKLRDLDSNDVVALGQCGREIRQWLNAAHFPPDLEADIRQHYQALVRENGAQASYAVRSSATAEDLPEASFAGQQETYLNIQGEDALLDTIRAVFASLYNDRAIAYRVHQGFAHDSVALSAGVQRMVRSDLASSGVMFTLDTESGFDGVVFITAAYGLGETVVQGLVNPDEFYVHKARLQDGYPALLQKRLGNKQVRMIFTEDNHHQASTQVLDTTPAEQQQFCLSPQEVLHLAQLAINIEQHYGRPMDIEWAKDGQDGLLYIVQARPETVKSQAHKNKLKNYRLKEKGPVLAEGRSIGQAIGQGVARVILSAADMQQINPGDVLVTDMTDPDWEPIMKKAAAIVTNRGGRTCHAAIIAREMGIPAIVGCHDATDRIPNEQAVTVACAEGDVGRVYEGLLDFEVNEVTLEKLPELPVKLMLNVGAPERAFDFQFLPNHGVGLARLEFIINNLIGVHPRALLGFNQQPEDIKQEIERRMAGYADPSSFFIEKLSEGIATIAGAFWPKQVIVRFSDFKSNEYANLIGGEAFEPHEENPMIGFRGASRYVSRDFERCFEMECFAIKKVRDEMGLTNVAVMIPFVRTPEEAHNVINLLSDNELKRGENGLKIMMMCEIPANALIADQFLKFFDGYSIGSNDLTQLTLGLDRDSALVAELFDERNDAVKVLLAQAIRSCRAKNKYIGICGQGPSDYPEFAAWLIDQGIQTISLNPDSLIATWQYLADTLKVK
ncbi:MAG: phosphoenolpyruvate synthase [Gammaproteobacteria bacterium]